MRSTTAGAGRRRTMRLGSPRRGASGGAGAGALKIGEDFDAVIFAMGIDEFAEGLAMPQARDSGACRASGRGCATEVKTVATKARRSG